MNKLLRNIVLTCVMAASSLSAADLQDCITDGSLWKMPSKEFTNKYLVGLRYRDSGDDTMTLLCAGSLTIGDFKPELMELVWGEDKKNVASLRIMLYNKGDDGALEKKEFTKKVKDAQAMLDEMLPVKGKNKSIAAKESGVKLKARVWEWENGAVMLESHDSGRGKNYESEFIRLRFAPSMEALERGGSADAGSRRSLKSNVKEDKDGGVWIDNIPMVDQGEKGYCLPATVARVFSYYGMDGVDMHAMASLCDTAGSGGTTVSGMLAALKTIGSRFHVKAIEVKDKSRKPSLESIVESYNKFARRQGKPAARGFANVADRELDGMLEQFDQEILKKSFPVKKAGIDKWFKPVYRHIDNGMPVLWAVPGHMRMIIGYNLEKDTIYYSDTWGAGHEKKEMSIYSAYMLTQYRCILRLSK